MSTPEYVEQHVQKLKAAYEKAGEKLQAKAKDREGDSDQTATDDIPIGTIVLLRYRPLGRNKIQDPWGPKEYVLVECVDPNRSVYRVEPKDGSVATRILNHINLNPKTRPNNRDKEPFNKRGAKCQLVEDRSPAERSSDEETSDEDYEIVLHWPTPPRRSSRTTTGQHHNPNRLPRSVVRT